MISSELEGSIVPFGKYRGYSVDAVLADPDYCRWLKAQPWIEQKFPAFYAVIVTNGASLVINSLGTPDEQGSPEHNEMQARFLEPGWRLALAQQLMNDHGFGTAVKKLEHWLGCDKPTAVTGYGEYLSSCSLCGYRKSCPGQHRSISTNSPRTLEPKFEDSGWDVTFTFMPWTLDWYCECTDRVTCSHCAEHCEHCSPYQRDRSNCTDCKHASKIWTHCQAWHGGDRYVEPFESFSADTMQLGIELKPDLGDDYPVVLRQVQRYADNDQRRFRHKGDYVPGTHVVVARRAQFRDVTWEQVRRIFATSGIQLIRESDIG